MSKIWQDISVIIPEIFLVGGIVLLIIFASFDLFKKTSYFFITCSALIVTFYLYQSQVLSGNSHISKLYFSNMIVLDSLAYSAKIILSLSFITFLIHAAFFYKNAKAEIYILALGLFLGLIILSVSNHFLIGYFGLECSSFCTYMLVASGKSKNDFEGAIKYLIFGATSTAISLFGVSLIYGLSHSLFLDHLNTIAGQHDIWLNVVSFMILGGFFYKAGLAPFHNWLPDVYETTATPVLSFLSFAPKLGAMVFIARYLNVVPVDISIILVAIIILSMAVGNFSALWQGHIKRLLGYSGIAQAGFILVGLLKVNNSSNFAAFYYLIAYLPISMGSFFLVDVLYFQTKSYSFDSYNGLAKNHRILAINAVFIMMALIGLPPTMGFLAKLLVFSSIAANSVHNNLYYFLILFGLLNTAVSMFYYLKLPYHLFFKKPLNSPLVSSNGWSLLFLSLFSFAILFFFFYASPVTKFVGAIRLK